MFLNIWSCTAAIRKDKDNWSAHLLKTVVWISKIRHPHTKMMWFMIIYANCAHTVMTYIQALYRCILLSTAAVHTQSIVGGIMCCFKSNLRWVWKGSDPPPPSASPARCINSVTCCSWGRCRIRTQTRYRHIVNASLQSGWQSDSWYCHGQRCFDVSMHNMSWELHNDVWSSLLTDDVTIGNGFNMVNVNKGINRHVANVALITDWFKVSVLDSPECDAEWNRVRLPICHLCLYCCIFMKHSPRLEEKRSWITETFSTCRCITTSTSTAQSKFLSTHIFAFTSSVILPPLAFSLNTSYD